MRRGLMLWCLAGLLLLACGGGGGATADHGKPGLAKEVVIFDANLFEVTIGVEVVSPEAEEDPDDASDGDGPASVDNAVPTCGPRTQFVYVVTEENKLLRFDPKLPTFKTIGTLGCNTSFAASPFSMAIDRLANAWVLYDDDTLYKVSTVDASCEATSFQTGQQGFDVFGMGFASDSAGSDSETLFVSRNDGTGAQDSTLGTIAFPSLALSVVNALPPGIGSAELSGNGLGELWGFFPEGDVVARIDKVGATLSNPIALPSSTIVPNARAWAFACWGGAFYLFYRSQDDSSSSVYRVDAAGKIETLLSDTGWTITGAGVSSCAPTGKP